MKFKILIPVLLVMPIAFGHSGSAQAEEIDRELFNLCSMFPLNSRCEGFETPIPLSLRSGDEATCQITLADTKLSGRCKINLTDTTMTAYIETGSGLDILEGKKRSQEISIPMNTIGKLTYREDTEVDTGQLIGNILLFGVLGPAMTRPDNISQLEINYATSSEIGSENSNVLIIETDRDLGLEVRDKLQQLTGIQAEIPSAAEPKPENQPEANPETH